MTIEVGNGECSQHVVFIYAYPTVIVITAIQGIAKGQAVRFVHRTAGIFSRASGLTLYSARKQLNEWTRGDNPKLLMTPRGKEHIYTEV